MMMPLKEYIRRKMAMEEVERTTPTPIPPATPGPSRDFVFDQSILPKVDPESIPVPDPMPHPHPPSLTPSASSDSHSSEEEDSSGENHVKCLQSRIKHLEEVIQEGIPFYRTLQDELSSVKNQNNIKMWSIDELVGEAETEEDTKLADLLSTTIGAVLSSSEEFTSKIISMISERIRYSQSALEPNSEHRFEDELIASTLITGAYAKSIVAAIRIPTKLTVQLKRGRRNKRTLKKSFLTRRTSVPVNRKLQSRRNRSQVGIRELAGLFADPILRDIGDGDMRMTTRAMRMSAERQYMGCNDKSATPTG